MAVVLLCRPCFMTGGLQRQRTRRLESQCREADGEHSHGPDKRPSSSQAMQSGALQAGANAAREQVGSTTGSRRHYTQGMPNSYMDKARMAEKCQRQKAGEMLCLFARCPPKVDGTGGTCHERSAARCRGTVEKLQAFVIQSCVLARVDV